MPPTPARLVPRPRGTTALTVAAAVVVLCTGPAFPQNAPQIGNVVMPLETGTRESTFVPAAEERLLQLMNAIRGERQLPALVMSGVLRNAARHHSHDMAVNGYIGHGSLDGESFLARMSRVVPRGCHVGENVAAAVSVASINAALLHSPGHRENILNPNFTRVGIGVVTAGDFLIATEDFIE